MLDVREASFTRKLSTTDLSAVGIGSLLYGQDIDEERASTIVSALVGSSAVARRVRLEEDEAHFAADHYPGRVNLFEGSELQQFIGALDGVVAVDLTSLEHRVWAPLVRALIDQQRSFVALYAEPDDYRKTDDLPGAVYDLSTTRGIEPLPGFARISRRREDRGDFAPLLGFEGARLGHIFDQEDVEVARTSPIVGSPGFRMEYPGYTFVANRDTLALDRMDQRVEFARASCPFEAYRALERVHDRVRNRHLRIAPIGTKPHALGAVLYAINHADTAELVYDHPKRSQGRTRGTRGVYVYEVSDFLLNERDRRASTADGGD